MVNSCIKTFKVPINVKVIPKMSLLITGNFLSNHMKPNTKESPEFNVLVPVWSISTKEKGWPLYLPLHLEHSFLPVGVSEKRENKYISNSILRNYLSVTV